MRKESNTYFYACKNRKTPDLDKQLDNFRKSGAEERNIFTDSAGKREIYRFLINNMLKSGDTLVIGSLFCLGDYPENWVDVYPRYYIKHEITARQARELTGLSQYLLAKYIREYTEEYTDCSVTDADQPEQN